MTIAEFSAQVQKVLAEVGDEAEVTNVSWWHGGWEISLRMQTPMASGVSEPKTQIWNLARVERIR